MEPKNKTDIIISKGGSSKDQIIIVAAELKKAANVLRAINHKLRQQILKVIEDNKNITVTEIYVKLRLEQSVASQHLAILRSANIVTTERDGKFIYYTVNRERLAEVAAIIKELAQ
jgi:DNA-binding transcriptional ArsR family regulator